MTDHAESELIYHLNDKPPLATSIFAALQHLLASFVGIITPTLVIGSVLGLGDHLPYLISMALFASGIGTIIQALSPMGIGAGMLCVQGTSFSFLAVLITAGLSVQANGGGPEDMLSLIFTLCFFGAFIQIALSQFIPYMQRIVTPLVTGIVILTIGISLIKVGMTDLAGGNGAEDFGKPSNLLLGSLVLAIIIAFNLSSVLWLRLSSIVIGLFAGCVIASFTGSFNISELSVVKDISLPLPFKYGVNFDWSFFIPIAIIFVISTIETAGDITANSIISRKSVSGKRYINRIKRGVLGDGVNSLIAALCNSFPNTTFSQNTGVIQLTGIASSYIGIYVGLGLILLGLFPVVGSILQLIPKPVLGGATLVMFGTIAASGVKILVTENLNRRNMIIMAVSLGLGLGLAMVPSVLDQTPRLIQNILASPVAAAGLSAIILSLLLPESNKGNSINEH